MGCRANEQNLQYLYRCLVLTLPGGIKTNKSGGGQRTWAELEHVVGSDHFQRPLQLGDSSFTRAQATRALSPVSAMMDGALQ